MDPRKLSRRDFAKTSALAAAAAALLPKTAPAQEAPPAGAPKLPAASAAEAEARYQMILSRRGARLSATQKAELHKSVLVLQQALDDLRSMPLANADEPALILQPHPPRGK